MRRHLWCYISVLCALSVNAQTDTTVYTLRPVEVSTQKASKSATSAAPMVVTDAAQMERRGVTSVSDAVHRLPGVTLRDYGGAGGLKTVSVRGLGASHTGVMYDGMPLSDVQSGQIDISRYSIDNVGSLSMTVGDNDDIFITARAAATPATLSINTMTLSETTRTATAQMRIGSFGLINPFVKLAAPVSETVSLNVIGEFTHADNDYPFTLKNGTQVTRERRNNSRMNTGHGEINANWQVDSRSSLFAKVYYYDNDRRLPGPVILYNNVNNESLRERNIFAQSRYRRTLSSELSMMASGKYNFASSRYSDVNGKYPGGSLLQQYWQREYYLTGTLMYVPHRQWRYAYACDYFYNNLNSNLVSDIRPYRHSVLQSVTAKFSASRVNVMARALYAVYDNGAQKGDGARDVSRLSPSVSASVQPWASQLLYLRASYKDILRMPTFAEAYFDHYGSKDLKPEYTSQINIGATYTMRPLSWLSGATFSADGYLNHIRDMIVAVPYNMFVWNMTNLGRVRTIGCDLTANLTISPAQRHSVEVNVVYSLQRAMPRTSPESSDWMKQVAYIPKHTANVSVAYENPWVNVSVYWSGVSARYTTSANLPATRIAGYGEMGLRLWRGFTVGRCAAQLRLDILNLLDKQYYIVARYPMPGRAWQATVKIDI